MQLTYPTQTNQRRNLQSQLGRIFNNTMRYKSIIRRFRNTTIKITNKTQPRRRMLKIIKTKTTNWMKLNKNMIANNNKTNRKTVEKKICNRTTQKTNNKTASHSHRSRGGPLRYPQTNKMVNAEVYKTIININHRNLQIRLRIPRSDLKPSTASCSALYQTTTINHKKRSTSWSKASPATVRPLVTGRSCTNSLMLNFKTKLKIRHKAKNRCQHMKNNLKIKFILGKSRTKLCSKSSRTTRQPRMRW